VESSWKPRSLGKCAFFKHYFDSLVESVKTVRSGMSTHLESILYIAA
jgi:hypothetical protein